MTRLLYLFWEFLKVGAFTFGGGMATLPFLYDMSDRTGWFTYQQIADMLAVAESTPGPIGINMATFTGFSVAGIPGSLVATTAVIIPGMIIVLLVCRILDKFQSNRYVEAVFYALRPTSVGLIAAAGAIVVSITLINISAYTESGLIYELFEFKAIALALLIWILSRFLKCTKKLHPIFFISSSAILGILLKLR